VKSLENQLRLFDVVILLGDWGDVLRGNGCESYEFVIFEAIGV
jgi:hypothetical protein